MDTTKILETARKAFEKSLMTDEDSRLAVDAIEIVEFYEHIQQLLSSINQSGRLIKVDYF